MEPIPHLKGGGGTSFVPVMDHLREKKPDVDVLIYFTDGYGDFGTDPGFDVIWVINNMHVTPPYGKVIRVEAGS
jgi:predicted metal-dependent peptidase